MFDSYVNYLIGEKKSAKTIQTYTKYVQQMLSFINKPVEQITFMDITNWKASISHLSSASIALQVASIKNFFGWLMKCKVITDNPAQEVSSPKIKNREKYYLTKEDVLAMIAACTNLRDKAIIIMYSSTGLRVSELMGVKLSQITDSHELIILGKGNKERTVFLNEQVYDAIQDYITVRPKSNCDNLFLSNWGGPIDPCNFNKTLKTIARNAGIEHWEDVGNHSLRHACACMYAQNGIDVATIRDILGHASISTTNRYLHNGKQEVAMAMSRGVF